MHELSIAQNLIEQAMNILEKNDAKRVLSIEITIGEISGVVRESLEFYYNILTKELDNFRDSKLIINETRWILRCKNCNLEYEPGKDHIGCPECKSLENEIVSGKELDLISMEVE